MDMTRDAKAAALLERAHELMNDGGRHWTKGAYRENDEKTGEMSYCSVGAIYEAADWDSSDSAVLRALVALGTTINTAEAGSLRHGNISDIVRWNDVPKRTWPEVSHMFKTAIRQLRGV